MTIDDDPKLIDGQHFYSKRNQVTYQADKDCVRKKYFEAEAYKKECWVYERLSNDPSVKVAHIISEDHTSLVLEVAYIHGTLLLDRLINCEVEGDINGAVWLFRRLYEWMKGFYEAMNDTYILEDVNLRNFIVHEEKIYGIDFEMVSQGDPHIERCMVLAMYRMYDPANTAFKNNVISAVIDEHFESSQKVIEEIKRCQTSIEERRRGKK